MQKALLAAAFILMAANLYGNLIYLSKKLSTNNKPDRIVNFDEHRQMMDWMREHIAPENAVVGL
jgi:hypothetical protein